MLCFVELYNPCLVSVSWSTSTELCDFSCSDTIVATLCECCDAMAVGWVTNKEDGPGTSIRGIWVGSEVRRCWAILNQCDPQLIEYWHCQMTQELFISNPTLPFDTLVTGMVRVFEYWLCHLSDAARAVPGEQCWLCPNSLKRFSFKSYWILLDNLLKIFFIY